MEQSRDSLAVKRARFGAEKAQRHMQVLGRDPPEEGGREQPGDRTRSGKELLAEALRKRQGREEPRRMDRYSAFHGHGAGC